MLHDLRLAVRRLAAAPAFSIVAVLTLALGIGANAAIASIISAVLLRPLPLPDADRLVSVRALHESDRRVSTISTRDVEDWSGASRTIAAFAAWRDWSFSRTTATGRERYYGIITTPGMWRVLGVNPMIGRVFTEEENQPGRGDVIVLTESAWRSRFGGDPDVLGQTLVLSRAPRGDRAFTIVGVMPDIAMPSTGDVSFWAPSIVDDDALQGRELRNRRVWARLQDGRSIPDARAELSSLAAALAQSYPASHRGWSVDVRPLVHAEVGSTRGSLLFLAAAVGLVLLVACANIAGLLIARTAGRTREFAVRSALGGTRFHMIRLVIAEAIVLGGAASVAALLLRAWLLDAIDRLGPEIPRMAPISAVSAAAITLVFSTLAAVLFGMLPAWHAARVGIAEAVKRGTPRVTGAGAWHARSWLVGVQIALTLMLLSSAVVSVRTLRRVLAPPAGFDPRGLTVTQVFPAPARYATGESVAAIATRILEDVRSTPGVSVASIASAGPLFGGHETVEVSSVAAPASASDSLPTARFFDAGPAYFQAMGATILDGREFSAGDVAGSRRVAIVNESLARRLWPGERAVGQRLTLPRTAQELEVVGVVADFAKTTGSDALEPEVYWPFLQQPRWAFFLVVRSRGTDDSLAAALRARLSAVDPDLVPNRIERMSDLRARATKGERFGAFLLGMFATTALLIATLGTYGLASYSAAQRTREFGIRISFGASPADITRLVLRTGIIPVVAGVIAGLAGAIAATRVLASLLPATAAPDLAAFSAAAVLLLGVAVAACLIPARGATRVNPMAVLGAD